MAKNTFKKSISDRYKGRGNSWVRVDFSDKAYKYIKDIINNANPTDSKAYVVNTTREGFAWMRYKKVSGEELNPTVIFEVRLKGSKIDQPEYSTEIPDSLVKDLKLLGNTPFKLQLESEVKKVVTVKSSTRKIQKEQNIDEQNQSLEEIANNIREIKEAALSKPTSYELNKWYEFLKLNNIYEESSWQ
tara:strand:+ start:624 stop:1187 length:564 start_codon:yes stop_codon:yes gene_type:complete